MCADADSGLQYPILWDVLGYPFVLFSPYKSLFTHPLYTFSGTNAQIQVGPVYFDRPDVKAAIHAPTNVSWSECASPDLNLFATPDGSDPSPPTSLGELPRAIERSVRTVIMHGQADFLLQASGTRAVIQKYAHVVADVGMQADCVERSMTWAGKQGFQTAPAADSFVVDGIGSLGTAHAERGLALYEVALSGHMVPQFAPWVRSLRFG
jgi:carboxypeptidase D